MTETDDSGGVQQQCVRVPPPSMSLSSDGRHDSLHPQLLGLSVAGLGSVIRGYTALCSGVGSGFKRGTLTCIVASKFIHLSQPGHDRLTRRCNI